MFFVVIQQPDDRECPIPVLIQCPNRQQVDPARRCPVGQDVARPEGGDMPGPPTYRLARRLRAHQAGADPGQDRCPPSPLMRVKILPAAEARAGVNDLKSAVTDFGGESAPLMLADGKRQPYHGSLVLISQVRGELGQNQLVSLLVAQPVLKSISIGDTYVASGIVRPQASSRGTHKESIAASCAACNRPSRPSRATRPHEERP